jgi:hypothetical protein
MANHGPAQSPRFAGMSSGVLFRLGGDKASGLVQELNGIGRARAGGPDRFTVRAQDGSPICDILRVLQASRDIEFCAQEGGSKFCDEFLKRVGIITEAFTEFAREAVCSAAPVAVMPISA